MSLPRIYEKQLVQEATNDVPLTQFKCPVKLRRFSTDIFAARFIEATRGLIQLDDNASDTGETRNKNGHK